MNSIKNTLSDMNRDFHIMTDNSTKAPRHTHWYLELGYVAGGSANHIWNGKTNIIKEGDFFIIGSHSFHSYMSLDKDFEIINIMFNPVFFDSSLAGASTFFDVLESSVFDFDINLFSFKPTPYTYTDQDGSIKKLILEIKEEYENKEPGYLKIIRAKLIELIIKAVRPFYIDTPQSEGYISSNLSDVLEYINRNYMEHITLEEICKISNYTVPYMSKKFKAAFGISFLQYITQLRITASRRYLVNTSKTIDEIMDLVGYKDKKSFYSSFRKITGTTPDAYRRKKSTP